MSLDALDPVLQAPKRLAIAAMLRATVNVDFQFLKRHLGLSDSDLSKQMTALADAGYVEVSKTRPGRQGSTTYRITRAGRQAFDAHRGALEALVNPVLPTP